MASPSQYISIGMGLDIQDLRQGLSDAKSAISEADSVFENNTAGLGKWDTNVNGLTQKLVAMATEMEAKKSIVEGYRAELERTVNEFGEGSKEARAMQTQLNKSEASYKKAEAYTASLEKKLEDLYNSESIATEDTESLRKKIALLKKQEDSLTKSIGQTEVELAQAKEQYGENSKQVSTLTSRLKTQKTQLGYVEDALNAYETELRTARSTTKTTTSYTTKLTTALGKMKSACKTAIKSGVEKLKESLSNLGSRAMHGLASAVGNFAKETLQLGMDFGQTMQLVKANSRASDEEMELLEKTAREFGRTTTFSAVEAAEALNYMALASWDAQKSSEALGGILALASASGMDLADASDMVTDNLSAFKMEASQSTHFADALAYAQSNSNTTAEALGEAYKNSAAKLAGSGQTMEATTALLMAMANQGTKGSEAGTALASTMADITKKMKDITKKMKDGAIQIGSASVKVSDARGNFRSLASIMADVEKAVSKLGTADRATALGMVFTSRSLTAVNEILSEGASKVVGYEKALKDSDGTAQEMADTMNDSLAGDMKALNSALDDVKLRIFDCLEGPLRGVVQFITDSIPKIIDFCEEVYDFFVKLYDDLKPLWDALKEFADWCGKMGGMVGQAIGDIAEEMGKHESEFKTFGKATVDAIEEPWETVPGFFGDIWGASKKTFSDDTGTVKTIGMSLVKGFTSDAGWNGVVGFFENIWNGITSKFDEKVEPLKKAGEGLYNAFTGAWNTVSSWAGGVLEKVKGALSDPLGTIKSQGEKLYNSFVGAWNTVSSWAGGIVSSIKGGLSDPLGAIKGAGEGLFGKFKSAWDTASSWAGGVFETIKKAFSDPLGTMKTKGEGLWNGLKSGFSNVQSWFSTNVVSPIEGAFTGMDTWATKTFGGVWSAIKAPFEGVYIWFKTNVYDKVVGVFRPILQFFGIGGEASDPLAETKRQIEEAEKAYKTATEAYNSAYQGWIEDRRYEGYGSSAERASYNVYVAKQTAYQQAKATLDGLKKALSEQEAKVGSDGIGGIKTSIQSAFDGVEGIITKPFTDAWNTITGVFGGIGTWFEENVIKPIQDLLKPVGEAVTEGVVGGMVDTKQSITTGTQTLGSWIVGGVCKALGVNSPSKVMHDKVGLMIGAGIALGIEDSTREAVRATEGLGRAVSDGLRLTASVGSPSVARSVPNTVVYNQTINSPDPLSAGQIYRDTRSLLGRRQWA